MPRLYFGTGISQARHLQIYPPIHVHLCYTTLRPYPAFIPKTKPAYKLQAAASVMKVRNSQSYM